MKKSIVIHPFLFAIYPLLFVYSNDIQQVSLYDLVLPMIIVQAFTFAMVLLPGIIIRDYKKTAIITSIFLLLFFFYGYIYLSIKGLTLGSFLIGRHRYLIFTCGIIFVSISYFTLKATRDLQKITNVFNIGASVLIAFCIINMGTYYLKAIDTWEDSKIDIQLWETDSVYSERVTTYRDIYHIILDTYPSTSSLKEFYGYDNQEFIDYLTDKGFYVASESICNYPSTTTSLLSTLNMKYIDSLESGDMYKMVENNRVIQFLKSKGYKFVNFSSGAKLTNFNKYADLNVRTGIDNEFLTVLIRSTALLIVEDFFGFLKRRKTLETFDKIANTHVEGPAYYFAHLMVPHGPYVFGRQGEAVDYTKLVMFGYSWEEWNPHLDQTIFITSKLKELVDRILSKSDVSPIIILQSDTGPCLKLNQKNGWPEYPTDDMLKERFRIINAYYFPEGGENLLYKSISPINTFRVLFDYYFDMDYGLLDDISYYFPHNQHSYQLTDVTDIVKYD